MALVPLWKWNVLINNNNNGSNSTIHNATQNIITKTYTYTYSYDDSFSGYNTTLEKRIVNTTTFSNDKVEKSWVVPANKGGFYRIRSWADESVDHWIYVNGREFLHNTSGQRTSTTLYIYLNDNDRVRIQQNNDNDFHGYDFTFTRITSSFQYQWETHFRSSVDSYPAIIHSAYVDGEIT